MRQSGPETVDEKAPAPNYRAFLEHLADVAAAATLPHFRRTGRIDSKGGETFDPVTDADRDAERAIRAEIEATYPAHGILGEEFADRAVDAEHVWVIDPIDGTRSFISGLPIWGTLIGLLERGRPALGLMAQPFTGERYFGDGRTAEYAGPGGGRPIRTRACDAIEAAVIFTTSPHHFSDGDLAAYRRVEDQARLARYGTDCYAYCMLASGFVDAVIESELNPYDILPLIPVIEGAGGIVTDWQGNPPPQSGQVVASGDARLHEQILKRLAG